MKDTVVYKFYNKDNELLYVGITNNFTNRYWNHKSDKEWFREIYMIFVSNNMTRNTARIYEIYYIAKLNPKYNIDCVYGGDVDIALVDIEFNQHTPNNKPSDDECVVLKCNEIIGLNTYMQSMINKKLFYEDQIELTTYLNNQYPILFSHVDYRTKKLQPSKLIQILKDNDIVNYEIKVKRENSTRSSMHKHQYMIISQI